ASAAGPSRSGAWWGEGCSCVAFGGGRYRCSGCANCTESRAIGGAQQDARRQAAPIVSRLFAVSALRLGFWGRKVQTIRSDAGSAAAVLLARGGVLALLGEGGAAARLRLA